MTTAVAPGKYALVYVVYNAISLLLTQDDQVACFHNAARHLEPGGRFVVELEVPELRKLPPGQNAVVFHAETGYVGLDTYDIVCQHLVSHHFTFDQGKQARLFRGPHRYVCLPNWTSWRGLLALNWRAATRTGSARTSPPSPALTFPSTASSPAASRFASNPSALIFRR